MLFNLFYKPEAAGTTAGRSRGRRLQLEKAGSERRGKCLGNAWTRAGPRGGNGLPCPSADHGVSRCSRPGMGPGVSLLFSLSLVQGSGCSLHSQAGGLRFCSSGPGAFSKEKDDGGNLVPPSALVMRTPFAFPRKRISR